MDNENIAITSRYAEAPVFRHVGIRNSNLTEFRRGEWPAVRVYLADNLVYDESADLNLVDMFNSVQLVDMFNSVRAEYTISPDKWHEVGQYEISIDEDNITIRQKEVPDFGEISPSQELNDFVNTLTQG